METEDNRISITHNMDVTLLYSNSQLHILVYKDTAIITTAKQGSSYLREVSKKVKGADKHTLTPSLRNDGKIFLTEDLTVPTKLDSKNITELFNGKSKVKNILFLFREPMKKLTGGLYQDFINSFPSAEDNSTILDIMISKSLRSDIDNAGLMEMMTYFQGRAQKDWKNSHNVNLTDVEIFIQEIFIDYIKKHISTGTLLSEGHTKPWCIDAMQWIKGFEELDYDVKFFNLDNKNYNLSEVLTKDYKIPIGMEDNVDRASNNNVKDWVDKKRFIKEVRISLLQAIEFEVRIFEVMRKDIRNITPDKED